MSTQQQSLALMHDDQKGKTSKEARLLFCETKDFVEIGIRSDVFYKIIDAERVLLVVGKVWIFKLNFQVEFHVEIQVEK